MKLWRRIAAASLLAATSCAVDPKKEVAVYRKLVDSPATREAPPAEAMSLRRAMELANRNSERLNLQGENYLQAVIAKDSAASNFQPTISLVPTYYQQDPVMPTSGGLPNRRWDVPVTGQANLFHGMADLATYRKAGATINQQKALLLDAQGQLMIDVASTYYQVMRSESSVEVLRNSLSVQDQRVRDMGAKQKAGLARPLDVYQTEAEESATQVALTRAQSDVVDGRSVLSFLLDEPVGKTPLADDLEAGAVAGPEELQKEAQKQRQDLIAARAAVEAARQSVEAAMGGYYPSVSLDVSYFLHHESIPSDSKWFYLLTIDVPIFSAGQVQADVRTAWSQLRQARLTETQLSRQIVQDTQVAYDDLGYIERQVKELKVQLTAAQEAFREADESYNSGLATNLERLTAQDQLLSTQLQWTSAQFDLKVAYLKLMRVTGQLVSPETAPTTRPATQQSTVTAALPAAKSPGHAGPGL